MCNIIHLLVVPSILDRVLRPPRNELSNLRPTIAKFFLGVYESSHLSL